MAKRTMYRLAVNDGITVTYYTGSLHAVALKLLEIGRNEDLDNASTYYMSPIKEDSKTFICKRLPEVKHVDQ